MARRAVRTLLGAVLPGAVALAALSGSEACSPPCNTTEADPVRYSSGVSDGTTYTTSSWEGPYLHFPSGRRFQLEHHLGVAPPVVLTYLAFDERPLPGGNTSESAGNQAVIEKVDDEIIQVRNDTCAEFWLRVVAMTGPGAQPPPDAGAD